MNNEEKARELAIQCTKDIDDNGKEFYNAFVEAALQEMAAWKEQQFAKHGYTKEQLREMGFAFTLNGDIVTPKEEEEMQVQYFKYKEQRMIEKAVEWMKDHAYDYSFMGDTCIEEFKQAMKEE